MILPSQIFIVAACLLLIAYIIWLISRSRLLLRYSLLWLALSVVVLVCSVFPDPIYALASFLGFQAPSNFIFVIALFFLLAIALSLSIIASRQTAYINTLVQEIALLRHSKEKDVAGGNQCDDNPKKRTPRCDDV